MTMIDAAKQAQLDQDIKSQSDMWPDIWWNMHKKCLERGFTPGQSMSLIQEYTSALIWSASGNNK